MWAGVVLSAGLIVWAQLFQFTDPHTWYAGLWPSAAVDKQMRALSEQVRAAPGDLFSEDAYLLSQQRPSSALRRRFYVYVPGPHW